MALDHAQAEAAALIIAAYIGKRYGAHLRRTAMVLQDKDINDIVFSIASVAAPVLTTFLSEDDPLAAFDQMDALERMVEG